MGGSGKVGKWYDFLLNTKARDIGVSLVTLGAFYILHPIMDWKIAIAYLLTFGLSWGMLTAYWQQDEKRFGFWAHGLGVSLAILPLAFVTGLWIHFGIRVFVLTALITLWSEWIGEVNLEEGGRGFFIISTLLI